tara:strand:+ start:1349 stop:1525 length:177 start_codon:yes stop_codon:yes gene_type:complete
MYNGILIGLVVVAISMLPLLAALWLLERQQIHDMDRDMAADREALAALVRLHEEQAPP